MKLKRRTIGPTRYYHKFKMGDGSIVEAVVLQAGYEVIADKDATMPTYPSATYVGSSARISFDTASGNLGDGEFATQENGFHWVKLDGCRLVKVPAEYVAVNRELTAEYEALVREMSAED